MQEEETRAERKPYVAIFGDDEDQTAVKAVWSLLSSYDLKIAGVDTVHELEEIASDAVLIVIRTQGPDDPNNELAKRFLRDERVVADIMALSDEPQAEERIKILAAGYNSVFNINYLDWPDFKTVLLNKVERGFISLENRIQQEEYKRFKAAMAASPDAFIIFDGDGKLFYVSEHYRKAYPVSGRNLIRGLDVMDAFWMCSAEQGVTEDTPQYKAMHDFWTKLDGEAEFETDGRVWHIRARKLDGGQGTIVMTADISRYKAQQQELEEKSGRLAGALEKKQEEGAVQKQFISMISHEFRTPLSIIDGNAQILQKRARTLDEETIQKRVKTIRSAVSRLVDMMEGVLSSSMLKTGKLELTPETFDLKALTRELCEEHSNLSSSHKIFCEVDDLPDEVFLDRKLVTLVIGNLLSNAVKFSPDDPEISVTGYREEDRILLEFQDKGIGIHENEVERIFERYYRTAAASGIPGSGIGLSLARDLVKLHEGAIDVESETGKGTKFTIILPLVRIQDYDPN